MHACIRETTSNNRVKSGYQNRSSAPIDNVPSAGARSGTAAGVETSTATVAAVDINIAAVEEGQTIRIPTSASLLATRRFVPPVVV